MQGPHHTIREQVRTFSGMNEFVIDSEFGLFPADGNEMLVRRLKEVYAIAQLKEVSRGDQFKDALVTAAKSPLNAAKNIVRDPVKAISSVPKGVMKFMDRAGDSIKNIGKKGDGNDQDGSKAEQLIGYSKVKRKLAVELGVDPYSTNAVLQKELDGIAWATWAGGFAFRAATLPISGANRCGARSDKCQQRAREHVARQITRGAEGDQRGRSARHGRGCKGNRSAAEQRRVFPEPGHGIHSSSQDARWSRESGRVRAHRRRAESSSEADAFFCVKLRA